MVNEAQDINEYTYRKTKTALKHVAMVPWQLKDRRVDESTLHSHRDNSTARISACHV